MLRAKGLIWAVVLGIAMEVGAQTPGYQFIERLYQVGHLPLLRDGVTGRMFSSYDRTGGNNDGFSGEFSKLREENGASVIAEMEGPGVIARIWFTHSEYRVDGLLERKGEHIKIFLDGNEEPAVDVPLEDLFNGSLEQFPKPLAGTGIGGFYCYVPIPYRDGCKVVVESTAIRFYHLQYLDFDNADGIETFTMDMTPARKARLDKAVNAWSSPGDLDALDLGLPIRRELTVDLDAGETAELSLPQGPHMVRAVIWESAQGERTIEGAIRMAWDGAAPAVDMPLEFLFAADQQPLPFGSLLAGYSGIRYYNFMPMPYRESATFKIAANGELRGRLIVVLNELAGDPASYGYFHGVYREKLPVAENDPLWLWAERAGKGHYVGTYMSTDGPLRLPFWLEGDEEFTVDGEMVIHGTGSEDYYNCGWYAVENRLNKPAGLPIHGFPIYMETGEYSYAAAYRWHLNDIVPYDDHIRATIEHGAHNDVSANYRSAAFFYDARPQP